MLHAFKFVPDKFQVLALHAQVLRTACQLHLSFTQQLAPGTVLCFPAHPAFGIRVALRRAVGLDMKPEDVRGIHAVNTCQRLMTSLVAVNVGQRDLIPDLLQQPESLPDKAGGDRFAVRLPCQRPAAGLADAAAERIVAKADRHLWSVTVARLADGLRQTVLAVVAVVPAGPAVVLLHRAAVNVIAPADAVQLRDAVVGYLLPDIVQRVARCIPPPLLPARQRAVLRQQPPGAVVLPVIPAERIVVALLAHGVIAVVVVPAVGPATSITALLYDMCLYPSNI